MIYRDLGLEEAQSILHKECYGHIGFIDTSNKPNVLPITYVYSEDAIYSLSEEGEKIKAMHKQPNVCMQVEVLRSPDDWDSVQIWGTFEELKGSDLSKIKNLIDDYWKRNEAGQDVISPLRDIAVSEALPKVLWRINIEKIVGKQGGHIHQVA